VSPHAPRVLRLVPANDAEQLVALEELDDGLVRVEVRAPTHAVVLPERAGRHARPRGRRFVLVAEVRDRVRPEQVAEQAVRAGLGKSVQLGGNGVGVSVSVRVR
jgi:hypothetical protein